MIDQRNRDLNAVVDVTESAIRNDLQWYGYDPQAPLPTDDGIYLRVSLRSMSTPECCVGTSASNEASTAERSAPAASLLADLAAFERRFHVLDKREALLADPDRCRAISFRARSRILTLSQPQSSVRRYFHYASQETVSVCRTFTEFGRGRAVSVEETLGMSGNFKYKS